MEIKDRIKAIITDMQQNKIALTVSNVITQSLFTTGGTLSQADSEVIKMLLPDANGNINCIECTNCYNCTNCTKCHNCIGCTDSTDLWDCTNVNGLMSCTDLHFTKDDKQVTTRAEAINPPSNMENIKNGSVTLLSRESIYNVTLLFDKNGQQHTANIAITVNVFTDPVGSATQSLISNINDLPSITPDEIQALLSQAESLYNITNEILNPLFAEHLTKGEMYITGCIYGYTIENSADRDGDFIALTITNLLVPGGEEVFSYQYQNREDAEADIENVATLIGIEFKDDSEEWFEDKEVN